MSDTHGSLANIRLAALLRLMSGLGNTVQVSACNGPWTLDVWFDKGRVVGANCGAAEGTDALDCAAVLFPTGTFSVRNANPPQRPTLSLNAAELRSYLDGMAVQSALITRVIPSLNSVPWLVEPLHDGRGSRSEVNPSSAELVRSIDGRRSIAELIGAERPLNNLKALADLARGGVIGVDGVDVTPASLTPVPQSSAADVAIAEPAPGNWSKEAAAAALAQPLPKISVEPKVGRVFQTSPTNGHVALFDRAETLAGDPLTGLSEPGPSLATHTDVVAADPVAFTAVWHPALTRALAGTRGQFAAALLLLVLVVLAGRMLIEAWPASGVAPANAPAGSTSVSGIGGAAVSPTLAAARGIGGAAVSPTLAAVRPTVSAASGTVAVPTASVPTAPVAVAAPTVVGRASSQSGDPSVLLDEQFTPDAGWPNNRQSTAWLDDSGYHLLARYPKEFVAIQAPGPSTYSDVLASAIFQKLGGPLGGGYGLILRSQPSTRLDGRSQSGLYYVFEAGDKGEIGMWRREEDRWRDLVPWTVSSAVRTGVAENALEVRAKGGTFTFSVNGTEVASVHDAALEAGNVGLFVGGDGNEVLVRHLTLRSVE